MRFDHIKLIRSLQLAYSAERAASFAYIGHARSLKDADEIEKIQEIERDEWSHRAEVLKIMNHYEIPVSTFLEIKYWLIGKFIGFSCLFLGRFMPFFFAGKLESGNVCEYFVMIHYFHSLGISDQDSVLFDMGVKEKEHEIYFMQKVQHEKWLPWFEKIFCWGVHKSGNDIHLESLYSIENTEKYCQDFKKKNKVN